MKGQEARARGAAEKARLIETALAADGGAVAPIPLLVPVGGEAVEFLGLPGETVESGRALLRVARFDRLLAQVSLPAGEQIQGPIASARIAPIGQSGRSFPGEMVGYGARVDPETQNQPFLFRIRTRGIPLRPGMAVTACLVPQGRPETGVEIPRDAVVWYEEKAWAYVQAAEGSFARREVPLSSPTENGWFTTAGFAPGERVVVHGAQILLSIELTGRMPSRT